MSASETPDSYTVQVRSRIDGQERPANRYIWWLGMALLGDTSLYSKQPVVGDWAMEISHLAGLARHGVGLECAVGKVVSIKQTDNGVTYTLEGPDGVFHDWENAYMKVLAIPPDPQP